MAPRRQGAREARTAAERPPEGRTRSRRAGAVSTAVLGVESALEAILLNRLERAGLPVGVAQYPVVSGRKFRLDRAWPNEMVACEVQGGIWVGGSHARGSGVARDCEKLSIAAAVGWRVLPVTREMIEDGRAVEWIAQALGLKR